MSISFDTELESALGNIPADFRTRIIKHFLEIKNRYHNSLANLDYDSVGISAGKFCEVTLRFLQSNLTGNYTKFGEKKLNFELEANKLAQLPVATTVGNEALRLLIPKVLVLVYSIRNKRGIGHVGGDVDANYTDAVTIVRLVDWVVCELIRIFHQLSLEEAQEIVEAAFTRNIPIVWNINGNMRVLYTALSYKEKLLLLLYMTPHHGIAVEDAFTSLEHSQQSKFTSDVVVPLHKDRLIEFDRQTNYLHISPTGNKYVEGIITKKLPDEFRF